MSRCQALFFYVVCIQIMGACRTRQRLPGKFINVVVVMIVSKRSCLFFIHRSLYHTYDYYLLLNYDYGDFFLKFEYTVKHNSSNSNTLLFFSFIMDLKTIRETFTEQRKVKYQIKRTLYKCNCY